MKTYWDITSRAGQDYGRCEGESEAEALVALHHDAGYLDVRYTSLGQIVWPDAETEQICGGVDEWIFSGPIEMTDAESEARSEEVSRPSDCPCAHPDCTVDSNADVWDHHDSDGRSRNYCGLHHPDGAGCASDEAIGPRWYYDITCRTTDHPPREECFESREEAEAACREFCALARSNLEEYPVEYSDEMVYEVEE